MEDMELMGRLTAIEVALAALISTHPEADQLKSAIHQIGAKILAQSGATDQFADGMKSVLSVVTVAPE